MMYGTDKSYTRPVLSIVITIRSWSRSTSTSFLVICTKIPIFIHYLLEIKFGLPYPFRYLEYANQMYRYSF